MRWTKGEITLRMEGGALERLLSAAARRGVPMWGVRRLSGRSATAHMRAPDLYRLRPALRATRTRVRVVGRQGAPFLLRKAQRRFALCAGLVLALCCALAATSLVWEVRVTGVDDSLAAVIGASLAQKGAVPLAYKPALDLRALEADLYEEFSELTWVGLRFEGVRLVAEGRLRTAPPALFDRDQPCDLVATRQGVIERIIVLEGTAAVQPGDIVQPGDVLVRGVRHGGMQLFPVHARAEIWARVWVQGDADVPSAREVRTPTGRVDRFAQLVLNGWRVPDDRDVPFQRYTLTRVTYSLLGKLYLPVAFIRQEAREESVSLVPLDPLECRAQAETLAYADAQTRLPKDAEVLHRSAVFTALPGSTLHATVYIETRCPIVRERH